ncbi:ricin-type beta-trefoil lectin domain protein [Nonomuraea sp. NPDC049695]|uniref:ricin-type beta-trefoil lectin domain protein n=1 Tax=Nonomuraea sp. NPDC049695 TaxID=3154734 RepID=UPI003417B560
MSNRIPLFLAAAFSLVLSMIVPFGATTASAAVCPQGTYQITTSRHAVCTHGPDAPPPGLDIKRRVQPVSQTAAAAGLPVCEGDGVTGKRVEVLYIHGSTSRYQQYLETFRTLAEGVDTIYNTSAAETGGERHIRFVTETVNGLCRPVVRDVQISDSALNANDWAPLLNAVQAAGYTRTDRKYLQFVDAQVYCGIGGFAGDTSKSDANRSNVGPEYARVDNGCWDSAVASHEVGHTLGAVNNNAPHASGHAHCVDEYDVMCYKDADDVTLIYNCTNQSHDRLLDCGHEDYYNTNPPAGSYLATYYNVADNLFLIKGGGTSQPPATFRLTNAASGTCLDDPDSSTTNGVQLTLRGCNGGTGQTVTQSGSTLQVLGKCVDAYGNGTANGTAIILWTCNGGTNQQWTIRSDGTIAGTQSGRCLTPSNGGTADNTPIVLYDCGSQSYQRWNRT